MEKAKRIGIDMRMAGEGFGIGRYITELVRALIEQRSEFHFVLFFDGTFSRVSFEEFRKLGADCRLVSAKYYSFEEQVKFPFVLKKENLSLVHFPNFNVPILYPGKFVVTIHDLIHHHVPGTKKKNFIYRLGYRTAINLAVMRAKKIIAVSNPTKNDIIKLLNARPDKIEVIHEGVADDFRPSPLKQIEDAKRKYGIDRPYLIWVGVWRKYKNLPFIAEGFASLKKRLSLPLQLVLVGEQDPHYPEVRTDVMKYSSDRDIVTPGKIPEAELIALLSGALCYVNPSLFEGFMLPSLEAQRCGVPVLSSDIPVAREIHGSGADYFDPRDLPSLVTALERIVTDDAHRSALANAGNTRAGEFTWQKTAQATLNLYKSLI